MVIAVTVTVQGISGGVVAKLLNVCRKSNSGYTILGANLIALELAKALSDNKEKIQFIDSNTDAVRQAEEAGFRVIFGNALDENILTRAMLDTMKGCIALTPNEEINLLFLKKAKEEFKIENLYTSLHVKEGHITTEMIDEAGGSLLFGAKRDIDLWNVRLRRKTAVVEKWQCAADEAIPLVDIHNKDAVINNALLPLVVGKDDKAEPVTNETKVKSGDDVVFLIFEEKREEAKKWFASEGWVFVIPNQTESNEELQ